MVYPEKEETRMDNYLFLYQMDFSKWPPIVRPSQQTMHGNYYAPYTANVLANQVTYFNGNVLNLESAPIFDSQSRRPMSITERIFFLTQIIMLRMGRFAPKSHFIVMLLLTLTSNIAHIN